MQERKFILPHEHSNGSPYIPGLIGENKPGDGGESLQLIFLIPSFQDELVRICLHRADKVTGIASGTPLKC